MGKTHHSTGQVLQFRRGRAHAPRPHSTATCAAPMCGAKARTVSMPGDAVSPDATLRSVWNGTPDNSASRCSCEVASGASAARISSELGTVMFMDTDRTGSGKQCLPVSVKQSAYPLAMPKSGAKAILMDNVKLLMTSRYGGVNISRFGQDTGLSNGGTQRVLDPDSDIRVEQLSKIANTFGIEPWQLLAPNLGQSMLLSPAEVDAIRKIRDPLQPKTVGADASNGAAKPAPKVLLDQQMPTAQPGKKVAR